MVDAVDIVYVRRNLKWLYKVTNGGLLERGAGAPTGMWGAGRNWKCGGRVGRISHDSGPARSVCVSDFCGPGRGRAEGGSGYLGSGAADGDAGAGGAGGGDAVGGCSGDCA